MKKLLILSGKGGTGKTTTASAFISFLNANVFADCDVDAPNLHLVTSPKGEPVTKDYYGSQKAQINADKCVGCGKCFDVCRFNSIEKDAKHYKVNEFACEGCGVCTIVCPNDAISMCDDVSGKSLVYNYDDKIFSTAKLKMGRGNSGKLVTQVKSALVNKGDNEIAIVDGSPGIGCPVIASISGMDMVLIVAEPSVSGISDMKRIIKTAQIFGTRTVVCINKYDTCPNKSDEIEKYCLEKGIDFAGKIPYDKNVPKAINNGKSIATINCPAKDALYDVFMFTITLLTNKK